MGDEETPVLHFSDETIDRLANFVKVMEAADRRVGSPRDEARDGTLQARPRSEESPAGRSSRNDAQ